MAAPALTRYLLKAAAKRYTEPVFHATPRAGEIRSLSPTPKGGKDIDHVPDIGIHLGNLKTAEKRAEMDTADAAILGDPSSYGKTKPNWSIMPLVADTNVIKNALPVPDMITFSHPDNWIMELTGNKLYVRSPKHPKKKKGMFYQKGMANIFPEEEAIKVNPDLDAYVRMPKEIEYSKLQRKDYKIMIQEIFKHVLKNKNYKKKLSDSINDKSYEGTYDKSQLGSMYDKWEPEQYNEWLKVLRRILKKTNKDSFSYKNVYEGEGTDSYMVLDPRKIKSIFAKDFDQTSHILTKYKGGLLVQPRRDYTRIRGI
tara:strand:- start:147 stop:1082 length:936 start_codon:yes stop_codon:yes gene_type:complete